MRVDEIGAEPAEEQFLAEAGLAPLGVPGLFGERAGLSFAHLRRLRHATHPSSYWPVNQCLSGDARPSRPATDKRTRARSRRVRQVAKQPYY